MKLTIFTPTYNRSDKLFKIYDSLIKQKSNDIEWIIIDDGSIDGTKGVVEKIKSLDNLNMRRAWNSRKRINF